MTKYQMTKTCGPSMPLTKAWNDAYLAAFTLSANLELVTFDKGLSQYKPARCTVLQ